MPIYFLSTVHTCMDMQIYPVFLSVTVNEYSSIPLFLLTMCTLHHFPLFCFYTHTVHSVCGKTVTEYVVDLLLLSIILIR